MVWALILWLLGLGLAVLVGTDPMYVYFDIDERTFLRLRRSMLAGKMDKRFPHVEI